MLKCLNLLQHILQLDGLSKNCGTCSVSVKSGNLIFKVTISGKLIAELFIAQRLLMAVFHLAEIILTHDGLILRIL